jgi:DNA (cytosine-5)-methyltransferase 1
MSGDISAPTHDVSGESNGLRPRLLDLFCGAGGASTGYARAGFYVVGVDIKPQPNYPFRFVQMDALAMLKRDLSPFAAIHASPPCQGYSTQTADQSKHKRLIEPVREALEATGLPYVIENVEGAKRHMVDPVRLCGSSFGLDLRRHRYFETNWGYEGKACDHAWQTPRFRSLDMSMVRAGRLASVVGVHGHINYTGEFDLRCKAMGIDWMTNEELVESIPPAYTHHVGEQLLEFVESLVPCPNHDPMTGPHHSPECCYFDEEVA